MAPGPAGGVVQGVLAPPALPAPCPGRCCPWPAEDAADTQSQRPSCGAATGKARRGSGSDPWSSVHWPRKHPACGWNLASSCTVARAAALVSVGPRVPYCECSQSRSTSSPGKHSLSTKPLAARSSGGPPGGRQVPPAASGRGSAVGGHATTMPRQPRSSGRLCARLSASRERRQRASSSSASTRARSPASSPLCSAARIPETNSAVERTASRPPFEGVGVHSTASSREAATSPTS
mmetsp:Transcript_15324/g.48119  ORF Transcript_15324/g.48119 Transcript_15324/m.48119 type:complete len:236 (+) Transcript_15324:277-984(+)